MMLIIEKETDLKRTAYNGQYKKVIYCSYKEVLFSWLKKEV
ncbi:type I restriction enzyme M protein, partial [Streptococcus porcorum]